MAKSSKARHNARAHNDSGYEDRLQAALAGVREGKYQDLKEASRVEDVAYTTLTGRANGKHVSTSKAAVKRRLLDEVEEASMLQWAKQKAASGTPMDYREMRDVASSISGRRAGRNWVTRMFKRHPDLVAAKPAKLDPKRAKNFNEAVVADFFDKLESITKQYGVIPADHIYNMDEKGIQLGGGRKGSTRKYAYFRSHHNRYRISSDNLELVTVVECVSAAGVSVPPSFVLSDGPSPNLSKLPEGTVGSVAFSESGWTDNELTLMWIQKVFIPFACANCIDPVIPILLIYDGHDSHETPELRRIIYNVEGYTIIVLCFPAKCTHKMQPLDIIIFAQSQRHWRDHCDECILKGIIMNRYNVIQNYLEVRNQHINPELIKKAFEKTGLYPVNRNVFTSEDFAPSKVSSTTAWTPAEYPNDIPSSDPAVPSDIEDDKDDEDNRDGNIEDNDMDCDGSAPSGTGLATDTPCTSSNASLPVDQQSTPHNSPSSARPSRKQTILDLAFDSDESSSDEDFEGSSNWEGSDAEINRGRSQDGTGTDIDNNDDGDDITHSSPLTFSCRTRHSSPSEFLGPDDLISHCYRMMAEMQSIRDDKKSKGELIDEVQVLRKQINALTQALEDQCALTVASNAHCTIAKHEIGHLRVQLDNTKKQNVQGSTKVKARFLTLPEMRQAFEAEEREHREKELAAAQKETQKASEFAVREDQIRRDAESKIFDQPLASYKRKDELRTLALAFRISDQGTVNDLVASLRAHIDANSIKLQENFRFSGLYSNKRRRTATGNQGQPQDVESDPTPEPLAAANPTPPTPPQNTPNSFYSPHIHLPLSYNHYQPRAGPSRPQHPTHLPSSAQQPRPHIQPQYVAPFGRGDATGHWHSLSNSYIYPNPYTFVQTELDSRRLGPFHGY